MLPHNARIKLNNKGLKFFQKDHLYFLNDVLLERSISSIANLSGEDIKLNNLDEYGRFGTAVHEVVENWAKGLEQVDYGDDDSTDIEIKMKKKTILFTNEKRDLLIHNLNNLFDGCSLLLSEAVVLDKRRGAVGTVDLGIEKNNRTILIDFKTSSKLMLNYIVQLNLYKRILKVNYGINYDKLCVIKIDRETMKLTQYQITDVSDTIWQALPDQVEKRPIVNDFWRDRIGKVYEG